MASGSCVPRRSGQVTSAGRSFDRSSIDRSAREAGSGPSSVPSFTTSFATSSFLFPARSWSPGRGSKTPFQPCWARSRNRTASSDLAEALAPASAARPDWVGGKALLALIDLKRGLPDKARSRLVPLLGSKETPIPPRVNRLLFDMMQGEPELRELALQVMERGQKTTESTEIMNDWDGLIQNRVSLLHTVGRTAEARDLAMKTFFAVAQRRLVLNDFQTQNRLEVIDGIGDQLLNLDAPLDAVRVYRSILERKPLDADVNDETRYVGGEWSTLVGGLKRSIDALKLADPSANLDELVIEHPGKAPAVDLLVYVFPRNLDEYRLYSVFEDLTIRALAVPGLLDKTRNRLERLKADRPRDLLVQIAATMLSQALHRDESAEIERLERLVTEIPLEALPPNGRVNASQRAAASEQAALWLVARLSASSASPAAQPASG